MKPPHRRPIIHRIKRRNLIYPHGRHIQQARYLVHDAYTREAVLALAEIENGHDGCLFVLRRVAGEDLFDEFFIGCVEFEGEVWVIVVSVSVLDGFFSDWK